MEWYWAWYVLGPDTNTGNTMMTPSLFCPPVWISKGGIKKNSWNIFFKFSLNLFRKVVHIDKDWAVTFLRYLPMSLSDFTPALFNEWTILIKANGSHSLGWVDFFRFLPNSCYRCILQFWKFDPPYSRNLSSLLHAGWHWSDLFLA